MRCLVVADLHYSLPQFDWLLSAAPHFDLVIFAGDALDVGSFVDFRAQIVVVRKYLALLSGITRVILCSGNHDLDERSPEGEKISRWFGEVELAQWIESYQPSMVISGHVHQSPFIPDGSWFDRLGDTWVLNTGLQPGRPPVYIVLDIDDGRAFWLSAASEQCINLNAPLQRPAQPVTHPSAWLTSLGQIADPILARPASATG